MTTAERADTAALDHSMVEITADSVHILMRDVSASTMRELAGLIADLEILRGRLLAAANRAEREVMGYACFSRAVIELTTVASKGTVVVQQPTIDG